MPAPHPFTPPGQLPRKTPAASDAVPPATADSGAAGGADLIGSLYSHALGPVQADYYLPRFNRQAASARPLPAWNSAAAFATLGWLGLRRLWVPAGIYAGVLAVCLGGWVALRAQVPLAVEATLVLLGALLLTVLPGLFANALYHRVIHHHTMRALQQSGTIAQAAQTLAQHAVTPERVRRAAMMHAAAAVLLVALTAAALYWRSAASGAGQPQPALAAPAAPTFGPPTLHFPTLATQAEPPAQPQQPPAGGASTDGAVAPPAAAPVLPPTADATAPLPVAVPAPAPAAVLPGATGTSAALPVVAAPPQTPSQTAPQVAHTAPASESASLPVPASSPVAAVPAVQSPAPVVQTQAPPEAPTAAASAAPTQAVPPAVTAPPAVPAPAVPAPVAAPAPAAPAVVDALTPAQTALQSGPRAATPPAAPAAPAPATAPAATAPRAAAAPAAAPAARPRATANRSNTLIVGRYYLHAGVFGDERNVQRNSQNLRREGLPVITQRVRGSKGELTRLRIGPFDTRAQAQDAQRITNRLRLETSIFQHK